MKYISDYSTEALVKSEQLFAQMSAYSFETKKITVFCEMVERMEKVAQVLGGTLEVNVDEERFLGRIILMCKGYYMFWGEDDVSRAALTFALKYMTMVFFDVCNGKLVVDMVKNLA